MQLKQFHSGRSHWMMAIEGGMDQHVARNRSCAAGTTRFLKAARKCNRCVGVRMTMAGEMETRGQRFNSRSDAAKLEVFRGCNHG